MIRWVFEKKNENIIILLFFLDIFNYIGYCGCIYLLYLFMLGRLILL